MKLLEKNKLYAIIQLMTDKERTDKDYNYGIFNTHTAQIEYRCYTYPQAQAVAAQFEYMVQNDTWKLLIQDMFNTPGTSMFMPEQDAGDPDIDLHDPAVGKRH